MSEVYLECATDSDFLKLEGLHVSSLKTDGSNSLLTDKSLKSIALIKGVREVDLEWATGITDEGIRELENIPSLEFVDLSFCNQVSQIAKDRLIKKGIHVEC